MNVCVCVRALWHAIAASWLTQRHSDCATDRVPCASCRHSLQTRRQSTRTVQQISLSRADFYARLRGMVSRFRMALRHSAYSTPSWRKVCKAVMTVRAFEQIIMLIERIFVAADHSKKIRFCGIPLCVQWTSDLPLSSFNFFHYSVINLYF